MSAPLRPYRLVFWETDTQDNLDVYMTNHARHPANLDEAHERTEEYISKPTGGMVACYRVDAAGTRHHVFTRSRPDRRPKASAA